MALSEVRRQQLDGIVGKMIQNGESDDSVQFVVEDFKSKYGNEKVSGTKAATKAMADKAPQGVQGLGGAAVGLAKGIGSTLAGAAALGEKGLSAATRGIGSLIGSRNLQSTQADTLPEDVRRQYLTPQGTAEKIGFGIEQVGEFLAPIPGSAKLRAGLKVAEKAPAILKGASAIGRVGIEGIEAAGRGALQKGSLESVPEEAAAQAGVSAVLGLIGPAGRVASVALGKLTGTGSAAVREAFQNPAVKKFMREASEKGADAVQDQALKEAKNSLASLAKQREKEYVKRLGRIKTEKVDWGEIRDNAVNLTREALGESAVKVTKGGKLAVNAFKDSAVEQGKNSVIKAFRTLSTWADTTPAGLDRLKKRLNQFKNATRNTTDGSYAIIRTMANSVDDGLKSNIPGYKNMTSGYRTASETLDEIERALSLGGSSQKETAIRKLMGALRDNNETRLAILKRLEGDEGDIVAKLSGAQLSPIAPRGIAGSLAGGFGLSILSPANWPLLFTYAAASSPRVVGEVASALGGLSRGIPAEQVTQTIRGILSQAFRTNEPQDRQPQP